MKPKLGNVPHGRGAAEEVPDGAVVDGWSAHPAAPVLPTGGWVTATGKLWPSSGCWVSNVARGHCWERWKKDARVSPESEFRFTATCFAISKD